MKKEGDQQLLRADLGLLELKEDLGHLDPLVLNQILDHSWAKLNNRLERRVHHQIHSPTCKLKWAL